MSERTTRRRVLRVTISPDGPPESSARADFLAAEEPLGIRVDGTALTMTMRTAGDDIELAAGFLVSEAVVRSPAAELHDYQRVRGVRQGEHRGRLRAAARSAC